MGNVRIVVWSCYIGFQYKFAKNAQEVLEAPIIEEELIGVLQALTKGIGLGPNGLTSGFFKAYP